MKIQVLCATMNQSDFSKVREMNIKTDVVFANQTGKNSYDSMDFGEFKAEMISTTTKGVGLNRNIALSCANCNICLIADDDLIYADNYPELVSNAFKQLPDADVIIFNIETIGALTNRRQNAKVKRVHFYNCLNYNTPRIALKNNSLKRENIYFSRLFGGGTDFSCGEDSIFIWDLLKSGLKIYAYPATIAKENQYTSTWFNGYNKKYLYDKGVLFSALSKRFAGLLCFQELLRHNYVYKDTGLSFFKAFGLMKKGIKGYHSLETYDDYIKNGGQ